MQTHQLLLYGIISCLAVILVILALGGGLFNQSAIWIVQWQHQMFNGLCHQIADRSFWINGQPMAVCSRCIGIYGGFTLGWLVLPVISIWDMQGIAYIKKIVVLMLLINVIDAGGDFLDLWENTLVSRSILGGVMGGSAALIFSGDFFHHN